MPFDLEDSEWGEWRNAGAGHGGWLDSKRSLLRCLDLQTSNMTGDSWKTKEFRAEAWISVKNSSCLHLRPVRRQLRAVCLLLGGLFAGFSKTGAPRGERGLEGSV